MAVFTKNLHQAYILPHHFTGYWVVLREQTIVVLVVRNLGSSAHHLLCNAWKNTRNKNTKTINDTVRE